MNDKVKYSLLIDRYVNGEMNDSEKSAFEGELMDNRALQLELRLEEDIIRVLSEEDLIHFRQKVAEVVREARDKQKGHKVITISRRRAMLAVAAAVVLVLAIGAVYLFTPRPFTNDKLFSMYYDSDKPIRVTRSSDANLVEALRFYQQRNYEGAIELFSEVLKTDPENAAIRFYTGISYIETEQFDEAIESFQFIINENDNLYIEPAQWHLGLCYLKSKQTDKAEAQFMKIAGDSRNYYKEDADMILDQIKNMKD